MLYSYRSQGEQVQDNAVPSSCFEVLFYKGAAGEQQARGWRQTQWPQTQWPHMTWEEAATQQAQ